MAPPAAIFMALAALIAVVAAGPTELVCDGQLRTLEMATEPYPVSPPWTPWTGPPGITCRRTLPGTSQTCGSMASDKCQDIPFVPVVQASGYSPGIIPPNNPLSFELDAASHAYLTYAEFRAGDIGTGGALIRGVYSPESSLQPEESGYSWVRNGPNVLPDGAVVFDSCGDCRLGFGVRDMSVAALPGTGFKAVQLSQLFADTRCEGSGVNSDGLMWTGMKYKCAEPTCGDTDLTREGAQEFSGCELPDVFNASAVNVKPPSKEACCARGLVPPRPQASVDVYVRKVVAPAVNSAGKLSTLEPVGSDFTFTLEVGVSSAVETNVAENVVLFDRLPAGLQLKQVTESPAENACKNTSSWVRCEWESINRNEVKQITLLVTALTAGEHINTAEVTTTTRETNDKNNRDSATARVRGACCPLDGSRCVDRLPSECLPGVGLFDPRKDCSVAKCDSLADQPGACCMLQAGTATCRDNIGQDECNGTWTAGRRCASVQCLSPLGACCDAPSGRCRSNITLADCQNPAAWQEGSICGRDSFCVGGCCDSSTGACSNVQRAECTNAASWSLYDMCNSTSCRAPAPVCISPWEGCTPGASDECCAGYSCQWTYPGCTVGPYACKPQEPSCVPEQGTCGGKSGGCCCDGYSCRWDHYQGRGVCEPDMPSCNADGLRCKKDKECCRGSRCKSGQCERAVCHRRCKSYECYLDRKKDCECYYAAVAAKSASHSTMMLQ